MGLDSARASGTKALNMSSNFSPTGSSALAILEKMESRLDQLGRLIPESISAAFMGKSVSNVIFRMRVELTVWRIGSIQ